MSSFDPVKDYYQVLDVSRQANAEQIKRAYHAKARTRHPDLGGSSAAMRDLNEAYEVLSDQATRKAYDSERGFAEDHRWPDPKLEAPFQAGSLGIRRPDRDLLWLTTRGIICALLAVLWLLAGEEAGLHRAKSVLLPWLMRGLGIATLGVGILFGYSAHKLAQQKMSHKHLPRPERHLLMYKAIFRGVMAGFLGLLILSMYLSK
jgi:hypothetical protein